MFIDSSLLDPEVEIINSFPPNAKKKNKTFYIIIGCIVLSMSLAILLSFISNHSLTVVKNSDVELTHVASAQETSKVNTTTIYVYISGAVNKPGVYELKNDDRMFKLVRMGGGISDDANKLWVLKNLNLASKLTDAQLVYVPFEWDTYEPEIPTVQELKLSDTKDTQEQYKEDSSSSGSETPPASTVININTASQKELMELSGIGEAYSSRIIENRPYTNAEEIVEKAKIPQKTFEKIRQYLTV